MHGFAYPFTYLGRCPGYVSGGSGGGSVCGDGILNSVEECDDGNTISGDGCANDCHSEWFEINTASISAFNCYDNICFPGNKLKAVLNVQGDALYKSIFSASGGNSPDYVDTPDFIYINISSNDGTCKISFTGGNIVGMYWNVSANNAWPLFFKCMDYTCLTTGYCTSCPNTIYGYNPITIPRELPELLFTLQSIPAQCNNKQLTRFTVDIRERLNQINTSVAYNTYSGVIYPSIMLKSAVCGDGIISYPEQCDDGNTISTDACYNCNKTYCGDGYINNNPSNAYGINEQCDGTNFGGVGCSTYGFPIGAGGSLTCLTNDPITGCTQISTANCNECSTPSHCSSIISKLCWQNYTCIGGDCGVIQNWNYLTDREHCGNSCLNCSLISPNYFCIGGNCQQVFGDCSSNVECDDGNNCTVDTCSAGVCQHVAGNAGVVCRAASGVCDVVEYCSGVSSVCPSDVKRPLGYDCGGLCQSCDGLGYCVNTSSGQDYQNECTESFTACFGGACMRTGSSNNCNGFGACGTQITNIANQSVCIGFGQEVPLSCSNYCSSSETFCVGPSLNVNRYSCNGLGSCSVTNSLECVIDPLGCAECTSNSNCTAIPAPTCYNSTVITTYSGICSMAPNYNCTYIGTNSNCPVGQSCTDKGSGASCGNNCGNGILESNEPFREECDDGNLVNGDGCDDQCRETACSICGININPSTDCEGTVCSVNDLLLIGFNAVGTTCDRPETIQIDYYTADGLCGIRRTGIDMYGINDNFNASRNILVCPVFDFFNFNYSIPWIPDSCAGKTLTNVTAAFYSDNFTVLRSDTYYYSVPPIPIILDQCTQFGNVTPYSLFGNPAAYNVIINYSQSCISYTCANYDAVDVVIINSPLLKGVNLTNNTGTFFHECGVADNVCPDNFGKTTDNCVSGVCTQNSISDPDCQAQTYMKCGSVLIPPLTPACWVPDPIPHLPCGTIDSCVYAPDAVTPPQCFGIGTTTNSNTGPFVIECSNDNTWCPAGYDFNDVTGFCQRIYAPCNEGGQCYWIQYFNPENGTIAFNDNNATIYQWTSYLNDSSCFQIDPNTSRRYNYCAKVVNGPFTTYEWMPVIINSLTYKGNGSEGIIGETKQSN